MFRIHGSRLHLCDRIPRRDFLRLGSLGGLGVSLPNLIEAKDSFRAASPFRSFGRAKHCLLLFLTGGPPQLDTWDLKPAAPGEYRGEIKPIATNVSGIQISELFPKLARQADKYCIVRSVTHGDTVHTSAGYTMLTGMVHPLANAKTATDIRPTNNDHPHLGSLLARLQTSRDGVPLFASLPEVIKDAAVNEFPGQGGGFLGKIYDPFRIEAEPLKPELGYHQAEGKFQLPPVFLPEGMTYARLDERGRLLKEIEQGGKMAAGFHSDHDRFFQQALRLIHTPAVRRAFQIHHEPEPLRTAYGKNLFGQGCLLGRRLIEAGVVLVTVYWHYEGPDDSPVWDTHQNNFPHLRNRLMPPTDQAFAALLEDLSARGLLDETLVICMGEFGRSPRINRHAGRDHWPHAQSIVLAGAGIPAGSVYGASDKVGAYPADSPVTPADLAATILHLLGVKYDLELNDRTGKPVPACLGTPIKGLIV